MKSFLQRLGILLKAINQCGKETVPTKMSDSPFPDKLSSNKVFISYTGADYERVRKIVNELERQHFQVWFAPDELRAGDQISTLHQALERANFVLVMVSQASVNAPWVKHEMNTAIALRNEGKPVEVIPIILNRVEIPTPIKNILGINMSSDRFDTGLQELMQRLRGEIITNKSYVDDFLGFVNALIIVSEELSISLSSAQFSANVNNWGISWYGRGPTTWSAQEREQIEKQVSSTRNYIERALLASELASSDRARIWAAIDDGYAPPVITLTQKQEVIATARLAGEELIEFTAYVYQSIPRHRFIADRIIEGFIRRRLSANPMSHDNSEEIQWRVSQLAKAAVEARILVEFKPSEYENVDANYKWFHCSPKFLSLRSVASMFVQQRQQLKPETGN